VSWLEETLMNHVSPVIFASSDAYGAVSKALCGFGPHELISTRAALHNVRTIAPTCNASDDEIVDLIVRMGTGRTMAVSFDHRGD